MKEQLASVQAAQERLIAALDAADATEIVGASQELSCAVDALSAVPMLYASRDLRASLDAVERLTMAAAYRLRLLSDHTMRRLRLLGDGGAPALYTGPRCPARALQGSAPV